MTPAELHSKAAMAEDTNDLLNHIAWTDVILPRLEAHRQQLHSMLAKSVLGSRQVRQDAAGYNERTPEMLAGEIEGINFVIILMTNILRQGEKAFKTLEEQVPGLRLTR